MDIQSIFSGAQNVARGEGVIEAAGDPISPPGDWGDDGAVGWSSMSGNVPTLEKLTGVSPQRAMRAAALLDKKNGLAKALINMTTSFVAGDEYTFTAEDEGVQEVLDTFWASDWNQWPQRLFQRTRDWRLTGILPLHQTTNPANGFVTIKYIPPQMVKSFKMVNDNAEQVDEIIVKRGDDLFAEDIFKVVRPVPEEGTMQGDFHRGVLVGDVFYIKANSTSTDPWGYSDLVTLADWLDALDDMLFTSVERSAMELSYTKHIKAPGVGSDPAKDRALRKEFEGVKPGTTAITGTDVTVDAIVPQLAAADTADETLMILQHIAGSAGYPVHFMGNGEDANRATADKMATPTMKMLDRIRQELIFMFELMGRFAVQQAIIAGRLPTTVDPEFIVNAPTIAEEDVTLYGATLVQVVQAGIVGVDSGLITKETASEMVRAVSNRIGVDYNVDDEIAKIGDAANRQEEDDDGGSTEGVRKQSALLLA